jgi:RHS repeat-associated protein
MRKYQGGALDQTSRFVNDGALPLQERAAGGAVFREYAWGNQKGGGIAGALHLQQGGQAFAYVYDGKGSVVSVINALQSPVAAYAHGSFGELASKTETVLQPLRFSTKAYDEASGLYYYGYRFYAPLLARWCSRDPLGEKDDLALYAFAKNDPINKFDPLGLETGGGEECGKKRGCVGYTIDYLGGTEHCYDPLWPEDYPDTSCYNSYDQAKNHKCGGGKSAHLFAVKGTSHDGKTIAHDPNGPGRYWDYCWLRQDGSWCCAGVGGRPQYCNKGLPGTSSHYPDIIFCVTCQ